VRFFPISDNLFYRHPLATGSVEPHDLDQMARQVEVGKQLFGMVVVIDGTQTNPDRCRTALPLLASVLNESHDEVTYRLDAILAVLDPSPAVTDFFSPTLKAGAARICRRIHISKKRDFKLSGGISNRERIRRLMSSACKFSKAVKAAG
jgi:hypothetical protein